MSHRRSGTLVIMLTLLAALVLEVMPMPGVVESYRPDWLLLVLCYWSMALPTRVNIGISMLCGLCMDILLGTTLGVHAATMSLCVFIIAANYQLLRNFSLLQQALVIALISALYQFTLFWLLNLLHDTYFIFAYLWPILTSMLFWLWIFPVLRKLRRQFRVS